jgi:alkanesulfonate monooxygenase SsuD/methylene tetrahydromethanopterin reductase-like flavin-dependent oxidoreductase (luciferase family)
MFPQSVRHALDSLVEIAIDEPFVAADQCDLAGVAHGLRAKNGFQPHVEFQGRWHTIDDAGINPRPAAGKVPIWYGGHADVTLQRVVKWGDGWMPLNYAPGSEVVAAFDKLRAMAEEAGRDPAGIGIDTRTTVGVGAEAEWRETVRFWKSRGVTHLTLGIYSGRGHLRRIEGRTLTDHLAAIKRYWNAVADLL